MAFNAFISYSHTADAALAAALQGALYRFAKPWYKLRALHIFRDQTNLSVNPALWSSIRAALDQSLFLILLASPEAAASPWVAKEAEYWIGKNGPSHLLIVVTAGTLSWDRPAGCFLPQSTNALPASLFHAFSEEPLFLDLRWARGGTTPLRLREPRFHEAVLQLASTLHNRPKDELDGADIRARRQARLLALFALVVILVTGIFALRETNASRKEKIRIQAANLATESAKVLQDHPDRARDAAFLAMESNRLNSSFEGNQALRTALAFLPAATQFYRPQQATPDERVRDLAFSPDGGSLATARDDGSIEVLDLANRQSVGYSPDEQPGARIDIPGDLQSDSLENKNAVSVSFNFDGSLLASGAEDGVAHVWALAGGRELLRISHAAPVSQVAFRPRSSQIATASEDGHVRIFDAVRGTMTRDFNCSDKVVSLAFNPDGSLLAARSYDGVISIFDLTRGKIRQTLGGGDAAFNLAFSGDGKRLASASGSFAFVWDVNTGQQLLKATHAPSSETLTPQQWIVNAALSSDGKVLAYAAKGDPIAHVWNVETGRQMLELKHDSAVEAVSFNADGTKLGTASYDNTARIWDLSSGQEFWRSSIPGGAEVVAFSPDGKRFAAGGSEGTISVAESTNHVGYFRFPDMVTCLAFSPDGQRIAMGSVSEHHSPLIRIAEIDGTVVRDIEFHGAPILDSIVFIDRDRAIARWSRKLFLIGIEENSVTPLPDVPDAPHVDSSGKVFALQQNGVVQLFSLPDFRLTTTFDKSPSNLLQIAGGGRFLVFETRSPPDNSFFDIWSTENKTRISRIAVPAEWNHLAFNSSGRLLFTTEGESLQTWEIPSGRRRFSIVSDGRHRQGFC